MLNYKLNTTQAAHLIINSETKFKNISETYLVNKLIFRVTIRSSAEQKLKQTLDSKSETETQNRLEFKVQIKRV